MAKKEFKIGEVFQCGLVKLKCVKSGRTCHGCYFARGCRNEIKGYCAAETREDGNCVIFVKVED